MLVWNDLEADEKIKVYDKGVQITNGEGVHELLVSYRSGDVWAPKVEQTEALKVELEYFVDCVVKDQVPMNDGAAGLRVVRLLEAADQSLKERGRSSSLMRAPIPFLDLVTPHVELEEELVSVFRGALRTAGFIGGPAVEGFERDFASSATCALPSAWPAAPTRCCFALVAAGVQPGDTVVTVPNTFIATTEAISQAGARPDFVDVDERTCNMDPEKLLRVPGDQCTRDPTGRIVSRRTGGPVTAVVPVHLYGQMADMDPILELASEVQAPRHRGCLPGPWCGVLRRRRTLAQGRVDGPGRGVQLLSRQEPGRLRRGGRRHDGRRAAGAALPDAARPRAVEEVLP